MSECPLRPTLRCASSPAGDDSCPALLPLDCTTLRMMAAWAGALANQRVDFVYNGDPDHQSHPLTLFNPASPAPCGVTIPSFTPARRADLASIDCTVSYVRDRDSALDTISGRLVAAVSWDCAFWSESAVEKFVVPFVATLGGPQAQAFIGQLLLAWNGYPDDRRAFGLLRRGAAPHELGLDLCTLFDVAYVDVAARSVEVMPLRTFLEGCRPHPRPEPIDVPCWRCEPGEEPATLPTQQSLRVLAEWVSACRDELYLFSFEAAGDQFWPMSKPSAAPLVIGGFTPKTRPDRPRVDSVTLRSAQGGQSVLAPEIADAVFWGTGAVEHVMLPYYTSVYGGKALSVLGAILDTWNASPLIPSSADVEGDPAVYALVHLPKSDWDPAVTLEEDLRRRVGVMFPSGSTAGVLQVVPFSDYPTGLPR